MLYKFNKELLHFNIKNKNIIVISFYIFTSLQCKRKMLAINFHTYTDADGSWKIYCH